MLIEPGSEAPDFELKTSTGETFRLSDLRGHLRAMLVFYPKDFTPGCTDQLNHIGRHLPGFRAAGIEPIGVNPGDAASHERFRTELGLDFALLVDEGAQVARAYGAIKRGGEGIERSVVVVGRHGKVIFAERGAPPWQRIMNATRVITEDLDEPVNA